MDRQRIGKAAEDAAAAFLRSQGAEILLRNFRLRLGELDIIARDGKSLAIVEVRNRSSARFGGAAASVDVRKQVKLRRAAALLLQQRTELGAMPVRFDVIVVHDPLSRAARISWIKHAFTM